MKLDEVFKAYDIRGKVGDELTPELAFEVGRALADFLPGKNTVAVGRDMRPDSNTLADNVMKGLLSSGRDVWDIGLITTDMLYFAVGKNQLAGGLMVTASHNPAGYNGMKLIGFEAKPLGKDSGLGQIKQIIKSNYFLAAKKLGELSRHNIEKEYTEYLLRFLSNGGTKKLSVAFDAGNGMTGQVLPELSKKLPVNTTPLFWELDGTFPNRPPNPMPAENLKQLSELVASNKQDAGVAFDGDGDRAFLVDEKGKQLSSAHTGAIIAAAVLEKYPAATMVCDVRMSKLFDAAVVAMGGKVVRSAVGSPSIIQAMHEHDAPFAAEGSGHFYFSNAWYASSGLLASLVAFDVLAASNKSLSELAGGYQKYAQSGEINFEVSDKQAVVSKLAEEYKDGKQDTLDGLTVNYSSWWFNVRPSNTEPLLRLNVEADSPEILEQKVAELKQQIDH